MFAQELRILSSKYALVTCILLQISMYCIYEASLPEEAAGVFRLQQIRMTAMWMFALCTGVPNQKYCGIKKECLEFYRK